MAQVGMHEAKTQLSQLVERAEAGEESSSRATGSRSRAGTVARPNSFASIHGVWRGR